LLIKFHLRNSQNAFNLNSILSPKYINIIKELMFSRFSETNNISEVISHSEVGNLGNLSVLNVELFKDFVEICWILKNKNIENGEKIKESNIYKTQKI